MYSNTSYISNLEATNVSQNYLERFHRRTISIASNQSVSKMLERESEGTIVDLVPHTLRTVPEAARDRRNDRVYRYEL